MSKQPKGAPTPSYRKEITLEMIRNSLGWVKWKRHVDGYFAERLNMSIEEYAAGAYKVITPERAFRRGMNPLDYVDLLLAKDLAKHS